MAIEGATATAAADTAGVAGLPAVVCAMAGDMDKTEIAAEATTANANWRKPATGLDMRDMVGEITKSRRGTELPESGSPAGS